MTKHVFGYVLLCAPLFKSIYGSYLYAGLDPRQTRARFCLRVGALVQTSVDANLEHHRVCVQRYSSLFNSGR